MKPALVLLATAFSILDITKAMPHGYMGNMEKFGEYKNWNAEDMKKAEKKEYGKYDKMELKDKPYAYKRNVKRFGGYNKWNVEDIKKTEEREKAYQEDEKNREELQNTSYEEKLQARQKAFDKNVETKNYEHKAYENSAKKSEEKRKSYHKPTKKTPAAPYKNKYWYNKYN
ncbi:hypothetical protein J6590_041570 [Homalodisca vitripennis]|nr:hypothetical protein J6590_041570 [Homalodisca vitripennis]